MRGTWPLRLLVPAVVVAALVVDIALGDPVAALDDQGTVEVLNEVKVPATQTLTSTWFCPVVHMSEPSDPNAGSVPLEFSTEILVTNITNRTVRALLELRSTRDDESLALTIGPYEVITVDIAEVEVEPGELMSAVLEVTGGGVAVTRRFVSELGIDEARCSSTVAAQWFVPVGDTQSDARDLIVIHNPLPRDAIVDVRFASEVEQGAFVLPALQGIIVPGRATVAIDVGEHARRRLVASAVVVAQTGRIAVDHVEVYDRSVGRAGFSVELAVPHTSPVWWVPLAGIDDSTSAVISVLNPTDELAEVELRSSSGGLGDGETFTDTVSVIVLANDVAQVRLAPDTTEALDSNTLLAVAGGPIAVKVASLNGVALVVATEVLVGSATEPTTQSELATESDLGAGGQEEDAVVGGLGGESDFGGEAADDIAPVPSVFNAQAGLTAVPGHSAGRNRWLLVIPPEVGAQAFVTLLTVGDDALASDQDQPQDQPQDRDQDQPQDQDQDRDQSQAPAAVVIVRQIDRTPLATIEVPETGVVTHQLPSGLAWLLESDVPFVPIAFQYIVGGDGLSGIVALPY